VEDAVGVIQLADEEEARAFEFLTIFGRAASLFKVSVSYLTLHSDYADTSCNVY